MVRVEIFNIKREICRELSKSAVEGGVGEG